MDYVEERLHSMKLEFIDELVNFGYQRNDVLSLVGKGIWSLDRYFTIEQLNMIMNKRANARELEEKLKKKMRSKLDSFSLKNEKAEKAKEFLYESPFIDMSKEEIERLGLGADSLFYDELRHIGFQKEIARGIQDAINEKRGRTNAQEKIGDRYKKNTEML